MHFYCDGVELNVEAIPLLKGNPAQLRTADPERVS